MLCSATTSLPLLPCIELLNSGLCRSCALKSIGDGILAPLQRQSESISILHRASATAVREATSRSHSAGCTASRQNAPCALCRAENLSPCLGGRRGQHPREPQGGRVTIVSALTLATTKYYQQGTPAALQTQRPCKPMRTSAAAMSSERRSPTTPSFILLPRFESLCRPFIFAPALY